MVQPPFIRMTDHFEQLVPSNLHALSQLILPTSLWSRDSVHPHSTGGANQAQSGGHCWRSHSWRRVELVGPSSGSISLQTVFWAAAITPPCNVMCTAWAGSTEMKCQDPRKLWSQGWCLGGRGGGSVLKWWLWKLIEKMQKLATGLGLGVQCTNLISAFSKQ